MFDIHEELKKLPQKPGVYLMKNEKEEIIYVGKAINLKNRVRQYFQSAAGKTAKVAAMVRHIAEFEYIITDSEMEALLLECNLIKKHRPYYNILLKDDKMYPYIKVTIHEMFPRIFMTRNFVKDKSKYYGPITDALAVKETIETIHKIWPIRKCKKVFPRDIGRERPCLNYHIGQCCAPCDSMINEAQYKQYIEEAILFIEGKHEGIIKKMKEDMLQAAESLEYEKAAVLRDKLKSVQSIAQRQKMSHEEMGDSDVIAFTRAHNEGLAQIFFIRGGKMMGREHFFLKNVDEISRSEVMTAFVKQFYSGTAFIPREIILQDALVEKEASLMVDFLCELRGAKVTLTVPQKGEKYKMVELAAKNALITFEQFGERMKREENRTVGAMEEIRQALGLPEPVKRIESFDISNTQGFESVGSMVVFEKGKPKNSDYRKFRIKTVVGANDYASMKEVITRRISHALRERTDQAISIAEGKFTKLPDLIMMDGGKIQVNAAKEVLAQFDMSIPVCGMIKDERHKTRGLVYEDKEIYLPLSGEGFRLITRIQDEVHRFAIEYHRKLRDNKALHSILDDIKGIGETRRKALMRHFGSIENIKNADVEQILEVKEMNIKSAEAVYGFFHSQMLSEEVKNQQT